MQSCDGALVATCQEDNTMAGVPFDQMTGKIWYMLACFGFRTFYAGYGFSADSVKTKKMALLPSLMLKAAISFYNKFFRNKPKTSAL